LTSGLIAVAAAYLLGGIPFGLLLYRLAKGGDIRSVGSGNIGATNVARSGGLGIGVLTLLLDAGKGASAVAIAGWLCGGDPAWNGAAALAAVSGHCFPVLMGFRGGKGVATGCGAFALLHPAAMGAALAVFAVTVLLTRMVSAGSILAAAAFPLASWALGAAAGSTIPAGAASLVILWRHRENMRRILEGAESRLGSKATSAKEKP